MPESAFLASNREPQVRTMHIAAVAATLIILGAQAMADEPKSDDWARGWCAGYKTAQQAVMRNRDHFRRLIGLPEETHEQAMKRIYAAPKSPSKEGGIVQSVVGTMADSVDLYVVLPPLSSEWFITLEDGSTIKCPD